MHGVFMFLMRGWGFSRTGLCGIASMGLLGVCVIVSWCWYVSCVDGAFCLVCCVFIFFFFCTSSWSGIFVPPELYDLL
jgi:hypothetical protein